MILTGKAKKDFEKSVKNIKKFNNLSDAYKNRKIINWFTLIGINLSFRKAKLGGCPCWFSNNYNFMGWNYKDFQEKAIKKANEIYNNKN